jgi:hypothetical protein
MRPVNNRSLDWEEVTLDVSIFVAARGDEREVASRLHPGLLSRLSGSEVSRDRAFGVLRDLRASRLRGHVDEGDLCDDGIAANNSSAGAA